MNESVGGELAVAENKTRKPKSPVTVFVVAASEPFNVFYDEEVAIEAAGMNATVFPMEITSAAKFRKEQKIEALNSLTAEQKKALGIK